MSFEGPVQPTPETAEPVEEKEISAAERGGPSIDLLLESPSWKFLSEEEKKAASEFNRAVIQPGREALIQSNEDGWETILERVKEKTEAARKVLLETTERLTIPELTREERQIPEYKKFIEAAEMELLLKKSYEVSAIIGELKANIGARALQETAIITINIGEECTPENVLATLGSELDTHTKYFWEAVVNTRINLELGTIAKKREVEEYYGKPVKELFANRDQALEIVRRGGVKLDEEAEKMLGILEEPLEELEEKVRELREREARAFNDVFDFYENKLFEGAKATRILEASGKVDSTLMDEFKEQHNVEAFLKEGEEIASELGLSDLDIEELHRIVEGIRGKIVS